MTMLVLNQYAGHRFPPEIISHEVWLYSRFPLSFRIVEEMLAARGILASHEAVRPLPAVSATHNVAAAALFL
jgi:putative transposase